jgi:hypothetical protein
MKFNPIDSEFTWDARDFFAQGEVRVCSFPDCTVRSLAKAPMCQAHNDRCVSRP